MKERIIVALLLGAFLLIAALVLPVLQPAQFVRALPSDSSFEVITAVNSTTVTSQAHLWGYVKAVYVDYGGSATATTDITVSTSSPVATIFNKTDSQTDAWHYPSVQFTGATGAAVSGAYGKFPIYDTITVATSDVTSTGTPATVYVYWGQ